MPPPRPAACAWPACAWPACVQHACHEYIIAKPDSSVAMYAVYFFVITHRSTGLPILITDLISKYNSLTLAPNMPCMLLVSYSSRRLQIQSHNMQVSNYSLGERGTCPQTLLDQCTSHYGQPPPMKLSSTGYATLKLMGFLCGCFQPAVARLTTELISVHFA